MGVFVQNYFIIAFLFGFVMRMTMFLRCVNIDEIIEKSELPNWLRNHELLAISMGLLWLPILILLIKDLILKSPR